MSYMRGDLLAKTRKLVKGLAKAEPVWLKAMEKSPPATFPRAENKLKQIVLPEDAYVNKFFQKHPDSKYEDAIKISSFDPPAARVFAWRVLELKGQGVGEEEAISVADMEYRGERKAKKKAYARLKQVSRLEGKKLPTANPFPSAIEGIQAEERKLVKERFHNPDAVEIVKKLKREHAEQMMDRRGRL
ncbi:uncharacterized protein LOC127252805 isoform X1 [Andrographis paniculata]|uniref:uncharacterized protein LOC127252805 isoform X1 n=1 Tax=Andrographis paniculata TaxID=175694 RepID=UPI0021E8D891|nr:uncharacterized protein LOC127252805 isoform X1 [Andrographis paniculata]XP_051133084.1 uncharacterized protein LOC127252805 isoform X1 [Andrographis paniculata]XP_051133088.1 uncharacterized protein LOC127252805 isoform X1 [Andrographis paniculata]